MHAILSPPASSLAAPTVGEIVRVALIAAVGFGVYGLTVGWWRSPVMGGYVAVKMPLMIALTLGFNGLLNGLLGMLLGSGLGFRQSLHALLSAFAITGVILGSVAPVTFFLAVNVPTPDSPQAASAHASYMLVHVLLIGIAGVIGVMRLGTLLESYCRTKGVARMTLGAWIAGNAFLGMQFSWILRPFFGRPELEVAFLRDRPMHGSFVETVWDSFMRVGGEIPPEVWVIITGLVALVAFIFFQNQKSNNAPKS
ncbi:MAG: hypothetical protein ACSHX9_15810 [Luteolibacter sp.]